MQASRRARNSGRTSQYYARAAMADRRSVELQPFEAERLSMQAGRNGNRSKFPDSGPVGHHPPADQAKAENSLNTALSAGALSRRTRVGCWAMRSDAVHWKWLKEAMTKARAGNKVAFQYRPRWGVACSRGSRCRRSKIDLVEKSYENHRFQLAGPWPTSRSGFRSQCCCLRPWRLSGRMRWTAWRGRRASALRLRRGSGGAPPGSRLLTA